MDPRDALKCHAQTGSRHTHVYKLFKTYKQSTEVHTYSRKMNFGSDVAPLILGTGGNTNKEAGMAHITWIFPVSPSPGE